MGLLITSWRRAGHALVMAAPLFILPSAAIIGGCTGDRNVVGIQKRRGIQAPSPSIPASWHTLKTIHMGEEKPGLRLDASVTPWIPSTDFVRATYRGKSWLVGDLSELRGLLLINDPGVALKYARLWSGPGEKGALFTSSWGYEIVDLKTFRCTPDWDGRPRQFYDHYHSGLQGVLSEKAFRDGGFSLPRVRKTNDGFVIERWVFFWKLHPSVQRIREFVGRDGAYRRVVVSQRPPPRLPDTSWNATGLS